MTLNFELPSEVFYKTILLFDELVFSRFHFDKVLENVLKLSTSFQTIGNWGNTVYAFQQFQLQQISETISGSKKNAGQHKNTFKDMPKNLGTNIPTLKTN